MESSGDGFRTGRAFFSRRGERKKANILLQVSTPLCYNASNIF